MDQIGVKTEILWLHILDLTEEVTFIKEENVFWKVAMDCGLDYTKARGLFSKSAGTTG